MALLMRMSESRKAIRHHDCESDYARVRTCYSLLFAAQVGYIAFVRSLADYAMYSDWTATVKFLRCDVGYVVRFAPKKTSSLSATLP